MAIKQVIHNINARICQIEKENLDYIDKNDEIKFLKTVIWDLADYNVLPLMKIKQIAIQDYLKDNQVFRTR